MTNAYYEFQLMKNNYITSMKQNTSAAASMLCSNVPRT